MLRAVVPGTALVIFLICTTSFAIALALGGGAALDHGRAGDLPGVPLRLRPRARGVAGCDPAGARRARGAGGGAAGAAVRTWAPGSTAPSRDGIRAAGVPRRTRPPSARPACSSSPPLALLLARGAPALGGLPASVWWGGVAGRWPSPWGAALATAALALPMALAVAAGRRWVEVVGSLAVAALAPRPWRGALPAAPAGGRPGRAGAAGHGRGSTSCWPCPSRCAPSSRRRATWWRITGACRPRWAFAASPGRGGSACRGCAARWATRWG